MTAYVNVKRPYNGSHDIVSEIHLQELRIMFICRLLLIFKAQMIKLQ